MNWLPLIPDAVPAVLRGADAWLGWRGAVRDGKVTKPPTSPDTGRDTDATAARWTFDQAVVGAEAHGLDGVGFALDGDHGLELVGVDIDHCRDPETGEIHPGALEIVRALDSYAEVSPSGTGLRVFVLGKKPGPRCKRAGAFDGFEVEVYDAGRYLTVTGHRIDGAPPDVRPAQEALADLYARIVPPEVPRAERPTNAASGPTDADVLQRARDARNGAKFERLYRGDASGYDDDQSSADLALVAMLAFWTQDPAQIDRIVRGSGLMRDKWDAQRGAQTYGERTVDAALASASETFDWSRSSGLHSGRGESRGVHSRSLPPRGSGSGMNGGEQSEASPAGAVSIGTLTEPAPREWTVAGLIPEGVPSIMAGHSGLGKSYAALFIALCVCLGRRCLGRDVRRAPVLWVDRELDLDETTRRAFAVARGMDLERPPESLFYLRPLHPVGTDETQEAILDAIEQHGVGLTVLDSLTLGAIGDAKEQRDVVPLMRSVEGWGTSLCIDHITKAAAAGNQSSASIFGSGMKRAIARSTFNLVPAGDALTLHPDKTNFGPASSALHFLAQHGTDKHGRAKVSFEKIEADDPALAGAEDHASAHDQTLFALIRLHNETGKPVPLALLAAERDVKTSTLRNHLSKLGAQVVKHGDNTYSPRRSSPGTAVSEPGTGDGLATDAPDLNLHVPGQSVGDEGLF